MTNPNVNDHSKAIVCLVNSRVRGDLTFNHCSFEKDTLFETELFHFFLRREIDLSRHGATFKNSFGNTSFVFDTGFRSAEKERSDPERKMRVSASSYRFSEDCQSTRPESASRRFIQWNLNPSRMDWAREEEECRSDISSTETRIRDFTQEDQYDDDEDDHVFSLRHKLCVARDDRSGKRATSLSLSTLVFNSNQWGSATFHFFVDDD